VRYGRATIEFSIAPTAKRSASSRFITPPDCSIPATSTDQTNAGADVSSSHGGGVRGCLAVPAWMVALVCLCAMAFGVDRASAQDPAPDRQAAILARVDGEPIYLGEVNRLLETVARGRKVSTAVRPVLQARALAEIVDRRLVLAYARRRKSGPTAAEVDAALAELETQLDAQGKSIEGFLKERSIGRTDLRRQITWNLTWEKYRAKYVTEKRLRSHFDGHRREFDGTQVSVSHILLRPEAGAGPDAMDALVKQAEALRREIALGRLSFAEAATEHSAGPSKKDGGRLGWIGRRGPMVESFSRAAFALEPGRVSRPVTTPFGVHLIRCDEIKPGNKEWSEVREDLERAVGRELLERLARLEQRHTPVEFTGKSPYFEPGTRKLVVP